MELIIPFIPKFVNSFLFRGFPNNAKTNSSSLMFNSGPSLLRFFLVETVHSLIKYTKNFRSKYMNIVRRLGKKRSIIAIARMLAETIFTMLRNNTGYIDYERDKTDLKNIDYAYYDKLESLEIRKRRAMEYT